MRHAASEFSLYELTESRVTMTVIVSAVVLSALKLRGSDFDGLIAYSDTWTRHPWTLATTTLLHANWWHLAFNVYWTAIFGVAIESVVGLFAAAGLFLFFAVASSLPQVILGGGGIGLSGIGYALFGFLWTMNRWDSRFRGCLDTRTTVMFIGWFFVCIALTVSNTMPIGNWAHGAGAVVGAATGWAMADTTKTVVARALPLFAVLSALTLSCTALRPALETHEARTSTFARQGDRLYQAQDHAGAEKAYEQAVKQDEKDWRSWWMLGAERWELGKHAEALEAFNNAADRHSLSPDESKFLIGALTAEVAREDRRSGQAGKLARAEKMFGQLAESDRDWRVWWNLGCARWSVGEHAEALEALEQAAAQHALPAEEQKFLDEARAWCTQTGRIPSKK